MNKGTANNIQPGSRWKSVVVTASGTVQRFDGKTVWWQLDMCDNIYPWDVDHFLEEHEPEKERRQEKREFA